MHSHGSLRGVQIPLNVDPWFEVTVSEANGPNFRWTSGVLNIQGEAFAEIRFAPISVANVVGMRLYHAYVVHDAAGVIHMASNPVPLSIVR